MKSITRSAAAAAAALLLSVPLAAPAAEGAAQARELEAALRTIVGSAPLADARAGIFVADVESGQVLFAKDADALLNPASNVKLVTTAAALARLGPEYRFATEIWFDAGSAGPGNVRTLYVKGKGDPTLVTERLWGLAGDLAHLGIRRVGDVVVDDTYFDGEREGPGFDQEAGDKSYLAPTGAASLNWNVVAVNVAPGAARGQRPRVELEPSSAFFELVNRATTVGARAGRRLAVSSVAVGGKQRIVIDGRIPLGGRMQVVRRKIDEPALYLGHTLRQLLELRGVAFRGRVRAGQVPPDARLVHVEQSDSLGDIVRRLNKTSNNFVAEQLIKTLGAEAKGAPGTWAKGVAAAEDFLAEIGLERGSYLMKNGSGLNDTNRFSARQLVTVLRAMWSRFPLQPEYVVSLPVAGRDGTMRWRMEETGAQGRLRAKTGTLENVTSLSGYVRTAGNRTLAFSVLVNDYPGRAAGAVRSVDAIGTALAAAGGAPGAVGAAVALAKGAGQGPVTTAAGVADLAAAMRTYYALGRKGDERNLPFLRTALRTETDAALRAAVAECVYLSDPDGDTSQRTFLEAVPSDPRILARTWAAGPAERPPPVLPSLSDLAEGGNTDALAKLVDLAPAAALDVKLAVALGDALASSAASAPAELVSALRAATAPTQEAAVAALASGLARSDEKGHPFATALHQLAQDQGDAGAFARALEPRLADAMKAGAPTAAPTVVPAAAATPAQGREGG